MDVKIKTIIKTYNDGDCVFSHYRDFWRTYPELSLIKPLWDEGESLDEKEIYIVVANKPHTSLINVYPKGVDVVQSKTTGKIYLAVPDGCASETVVEE